MALLDIEVLRSKSSELVVQTLPDGSTAIFEVPTKNVYSLNPSAAAAWEACASCTTLSGIATAMSRRLNAPVTDDLAHEAVSELAAVGLVKVTPAEGLATSRRAMLKQVAGVAIPVVLVLTGTQQRAHAQAAGSAPVVTTSPGGGTTPPPLTTTGGLCVDNTFSFIKGWRPDPQGPVVPLEGAVFELRRGTTLVATLTTGADGRASFSPVPPGNYKLFEISAPGGPWAPYTPLQFTVSSACEDRTNFNITNVLAS